MKKKVTIKFSDDDEIVLRGWKEPDEYFIDMYGLYALKITRQYYPLKHTKPEVIFEKENILVNIKLF